MARRPFRAPGIIVEKIMRYMLLTCILTGLVSTGCGGGSSGVRGESPASPPAVDTPPPRTSSVPLIRPTDTEAMPTWRRDGQLVVGTMRVHPRSLGIGNYGGGPPVRDGQPKGAVAQYLAAHAEPAPDKPADSCALDGDSWNT